MPGRDTYFELWARKFGFAGMTPADLTSRLGYLRGLRLGPTDSPLGGKITTDLKRVSDEDLDRLAERGDAFLQQEPVEYPADDAAAADSSDLAEDAEQASAGVTNGAHV